MIGETVSRHQDLFQVICQKANIDYRKNPIDVILKEYVLFFKKIGRFQSNYAFLLSENLESYPQTKMILLGETHEN